MKPYPLVIHNFLKFSWIHFWKCKDFSFSRIEMLGYQTKCHFAVNSKVRFGDRIISDGRLVMYVDNNAKLVIGDRVYFNEGMMISCKNSVFIGEGCLFGPGVKIFDNNHKFSAMEGVSYEHSSESVSIGAHCWIGANVVILKGVTIGENSVVGAGCVIREHIPPCSIVTNNSDLKIQPIGRKE